MAGNSDNYEEQFQVHAEGYKRFLGWLKFGMIAVAIITIGVMVMITR